MAITKARRKALKAAVHGDRIDLDDPATQKFLDKHRGADDAPTDSPEPDDSAPAKPTSAHVPRLDEDGYSTELADHTLHQIVQRYGTIRSYKDLLEANEKRERALKNHLDNEQRRGELIERELVRKHVVGLIDGTNKRLLGDAAKTIASRVSSMARGGSPIEDMERAVRDIISSQIVPTKRKVSRTLRESTKWTAG